MNGYDVFLHQTQKPVNIFYIIVIAILPLLWCGDCKKTMSLVFKRIRLQNSEELRQSGIQFTPSVQIISILMGLAAWYLHRRWRIQMMDSRCDVLVGELTFTESSELSGLKHKLKHIIDGLIEKRSKVNMLESHRCIGRHTCPMDDIKEDSQDTDNSGDFESYE